MSPCPVPCDSSPCTCPDPPCTHIGTPTAYADWANDKQFFGPGYSTTFTVINQAPGASGYIAYGYTKSDPAPRRRFWFFITMNADQAAAFELAHEAWRTSIGGSTEQHQILREQPPECGTPTTIPCPPDPLLAGTMRYVRDLIARAGSDSAKLANAALEVEALLLAELKKIAKEKHGKDLSALSLQAAICYLRSLKAGKDPSAETLDDVTRQIEQRLFQVLEAKAQLLRSAP